MKIQKPKMDKTVDKTRSSESAKYKFGRKKRRRWNKKWKRIEDKTNIATFYLIMYAFGRETTNKEKKTQATEVNLYIILFSATIPP